MSTVELQDHSTSNVHAFEDSHEDSPRPDLYASITEIDRADLPPRKRVEQLLDSIFEAFCPLVAVASVGLANEEIDRRRQQDRDGVQPWIGVLDDAALEARSHDRSFARLYGTSEENPEFVVAASPIQIPGQDPFGGVAVLMRCESIPDAERVQLHLRSACLHAAATLVRQTRRKPQAVHMDDIARVFARAGNFRTLHQFAYAITNAARQKFDCDLVSMGVVRKHKAHVLSISGLDQVKKRNPGVHALEQAMGECIDAGAPVLSQQQDAWNQMEGVERGPLHDTWRAATKGGAVMSVPILAGDEVAAVVSFRRPTDKPFDADDVDAVRKLLAPLAGAIPLVARATRSLADHTIHSGADASRWALRTGSTRKRLILLMVAAASAWLVFARSTYQVSTPATVVAEREWVVASPLDGMVSSVLVRAGDIVRAGTPLMALDTSDLELELEALASDIAAADLRLSTSMAADNPAEAAIARAERVALTARHEAVLERIKRAKVIAPAGGIVVGPGLADLPGQRVGVGQPLVSIAEAGTLALQLSIPEGRVTDLETGQALRFASNSRPEDPSFGTLERVSPTAVHRDGRTVFIGESSMPGNANWLRPGMEGVAIIEVGERRNWWLATHRLVDAIRMKLWID